MSDHDDEHLTEDERRKRAATLAYIKECTMLFVGVFIGFFWSQYFNQVSQEAHIIVLLLLVILCLSRYIFLTRAN